LIQTIKDNELVKRSIQKKWNLNQFLEEVKEKISISRSKISKKISRYRKSGMNQRILRQRVASGAEEET